MNFSSKHIFARLLFVWCAVAMLTVSGCHRAASKERKALRADLREALHEHSYGKAAELAERLLKLNRLDNGSWDRLVQAQFGLRDLAGVQQTLEEWRRTVSKSSPKLDEYTGDLAFEQHAPAGAVQALSLIHI